VFLRWLLYLLAAVLLISLLRSVIGFLARLFADSVAGEGQSRNPKAPVSEALHRDPVCGAFVAPSAAVEAVVDGNKHYFCSRACRDKFKAA
jgi:YHS domain-containing protein